MRKKILLCDRDITFLSITRIRLQQEGYSVETLTECDDLISTAKKFRPWVICVDIGFNSLGCEAMIRLLRDDPQTSHIPVLVFSTRGSDRELAIRAGAAAFLSKPFHVSELEETLRSINSGNS